MAFPKRNGVVVTNTASGTSHSISIPVGTRLDELLVGWFRLVTNASNISGNSWTQKRYDNDTGGPHVILCHRATQTEVDAAGSTLTFTTTSATTVRAEVSRWDSWAGNVTNDIEVSHSSSFGANPNPAALTPSWGAVDWRAYVVSKAGGSPSAYGSNCPDYRSTDGENATQSATTSASSFDPDAFTRSGNAFWTCETIGIEGGAVGNASRTQFTWIFS